MEPEYLTRAALEREFDRSASCAAYVTTIERIMIGQNVVARGRHMRCEID